MKTFKQYTYKNNILSEGIKDTIASGVETAAKKTLEFKRSAGAGIKGIMGDAETIPGQVTATIWELIDPSGIASYDDAAEAFLIYRKNPTTFNWVLYLLNAFNCIPNIPLIVSAGAMAAGAAGFGVGAAPGAAASAISLAGGIMARGSVKALIKGAKKHPDKVIKAAETLTEYAKKSPEIVEILHKMTREFGGSADDIAKLERTMGPAPGIKLEPSATTKPKELSFSEYSKLSPAEKAKADSAFAKSAASTVEELTKKIKDEPVFKELVDKQKWYRSQEGKTDFGVPDTLKWIVSKSDDKEIAQALDTIAVKNGTTRDNVIDAIKAAYPDVKFPKVETPSVTKAAKEVEAVVGAADGVAATTAKSADDITAATTKIDDTTAAAAKTVDDTTSAASKMDDIKNLGKGLLTLLATKKSTAIAAAAQIGFRLAANILNLGKAQWDQIFAGAANTPFGAAGASPDETVEYTTSDGRKVTTTKQALKDVGLTPLQAPEPTVYTFGGKVLTPAQAAALGSFATPTRFNSQTQKWEEIKNIVRPGQQIMNPDGSTPDEVNATPAVPYDKNSRFNEIGDTPEIGARGEEQSLKTGRIVTQNIPQGATAKNPLGREGMTAGEYTKPDKFNNPPTVTFDDIIKSIFGP